jgi:hypothetical protein
MPRGRPSRNSKSKVVEESASDSAPEEYEVERVESHKIERKGVSFFFQFAFFLCMIIIYGYC